MRLASVSPESNTGGRHTAHSSQTPEQANEYGNSWYLLEASCVLYTGLDLSRFIPSIALSIRKIHYSCFPHREAKVLRGLYIESTRGKQQR
jgi:hypothetical protein